MRDRRGVNETIASLLLTYIAIGVFNFLVEGPLRDPCQPQQTVHLSHRQRGDDRAICPGLDVHWGLAFGVVYCLVAYVLMDHTTFGFAARMVGGNVRAAQAAGLPVGRLILIACLLGGGAAGLAGAVEIAAVHRQANASLIAGYGFTGILVSFIARHHPLGIIPAAILFGGLGASSGVLQRRLHLPDASVQVLMGIMFVMILLFETLYGRLRVFSAAARAHQLQLRSTPESAPRTATSGGSCPMTESVTDLGLWSLPIAVFGGAIRVGTPFLFVSVGECLTEKAGRVNLGLEGTLVMGAMSGYAISYKTGSPWLGVLVAAGTGALLGALHAVICNRPRVNSVAVGIAMMLFGIGLAAYLGKPFIQPSAPQLPAINFGFWSNIEQVRAALRINVLFVIGVVLAPILAWMLKCTRWGMMVRLAGESVDAAAAMGYSVPRIRIVATAVGGALAGIGGSYLSLYYPGFLERADFFRSGADGGGPGHLREVGPGPLPVGVALVRRRRVAGSGAAGAELEHCLGRLSVECGSLHPDVGDHDSDVVAGTGPGRVTCRVEPGALRS